MRVAVVGSCQSPVIREWIISLIPSADVSAWHVNIDAASTPEALASVLDQFDFIITQFADGTGYGPLEISKLRALHDSVVLLPIFVFPGFQPDLAVVNRGGPDKCLLQGPLDFHMSSIIVAAYYHKLPVRRVPALMNRLVMTSLGFGTAVELSRLAVERVFAEAGYDLRGQFDAWAERGPFMYTDNHPHARVLGTLTRMALEIAGLSPAHELDVPEVPDLLAHSLQWPVYPGVFEIEPSDRDIIYVRSQYTLPPGERRELSALEFAALCYRALDSEPMESYTFDVKTLHAIDVLESLVDPEVGGHHAMMTERSALGHGFGSPSMLCTSCGVAYVAGHVDLCSACKSEAAIRRSTAIDRRRFRPGAEGVEPFTTSGPSGSVDAMCV